MALANGADFRIGGVDFMLATDVEDPYIHQFENLFPTQAEVLGADKKTANQNILLWTYDNFIGGDGLKYYDPDQPARWWTGNNNPRAFRGAISGVPNRGTDTLTTSVTPTGGGHFVAAGGNLWYFTGEQGWWAADGTSWTENTDVATELPASYQITAVASDGEHAYIAATDGTNRGIWRVTSTTVVDDFVTAHASTAAYKALAVRDNFLYAWTGGALLRYELSSSLPITHSAGSHRKFRVRDEVPNITSGLEADMVNTDASVIFMRAYGGITTIYEYKIDPQTNRLGARTLWAVAQGFTGKKLAVNTGIIYVIGEYLGKVGLFGFSTVSRQPLFLGYVGEGLNALLNVRFIDPSYGAQVTIGVDDGTTSYIYVYDAEEDAFSQLAESTIASDGTLQNSGATYAALRLAAAFSTTTTKILEWAQDFYDDNESWDWDSAAYDMDYPQDEKVLLGFHIVQDPSFASGTVNVDYQLDEDGVWLDAGTTSGGSKHTYLPVSTSAGSTRKFRTLRMRMTGTNGVRVFSITARAYVNTKQEVWKLKLDLRNEPGTARHTSERTLRAHRLRNFLATQVAAGNVVAVRDGRRYPAKNDTEGIGWEGADCLIEFPKNSIDSHSEGVCEVILRSVAPDG